MKVYVQRVEGVVTALFTSVQDYAVWPDTQEADTTDEDVLEFIQSTGVKLLEEE